MPSPSLCAMCHPKRHRIRPEIAHFHKAKPHFAEGWH
jgi:hypothetical protein